MKTFKYFDAWFSILLIISFSILAFTNRDETFIYGYFCVGGWQITSMITHIWKGWFTQKNGWRYYYHNIVMVILALTILGFLLTPILYFLMLVLLFAAPVMAIFYTSLCFSELQVMNRRPLDQLK